MAFNGHFVLNLAYSAAQLGADFSALLAATGKSAEALEVEGCVLQSAAYNDFVQKLLNETRDPLFGLHSGERMNMATAGLINQIAQTSGTVKEALEYCCEFANLGCSSLPMTLKERVDCYELILTPEPVWWAESSQAVRQTAEGVMAFTIRQFQSLTRVRKFPQSVKFLWNTDEYLAEYERVFGCPVLYGQENLSISLSKADVEQKVVTSDYRLLEILVAHAQEKSAKIQRERGFGNLVKQSVIGLVKPEFPTIEQVAGHLNLSKRTLQRRLKDEGLTYKELIDELRKDFALSYLKRDDLSISDIAYLLNYTDVSSFTRSFKRWTGKTPGEFR